MKPISTIPEAAKFAGVSVSTIKKGLRQKFIIRDNGVFNPEQLKAGLAAQASKRGGRQLSDLGGMPANLMAIREQQAREDLRLTISKRKFSERALGIEEGLYMPSATVHQETERLLIQLKDSFLSMPSEIAGPASMKPPRDLEAIVRRRVVELLQGLADGCEDKGLLKRPKKWSEHECYGSGKAGGLPGAASQIWATG